MGLGAIGAVGALASAGSSIAGGIMSGRAAKSAAGQESNAIQQGINLLRQNYGQAQTNLQPFIGGGTSALNTLLGFYGLGPNPQGAQAGFTQFQQTPFYQFPFQQGMLGLNRGLAASGLIGSGAALKEGAQFASGLASSGLGSYLSGLSGLASSGQTAATSLGQIGQNVGTTALQGFTNQGVAQGAGTVGQSNALSQGLQNAFGPLSTFGNSLFGGGGNTSSSSYSPGGLFSNEQVGGYSIPGTSWLGPYGAAFGSPAAGTSGGFNNGMDLIGSGGGVIVPPIPS